MTVKRGKPKTTTIRVEYTTKSKIEKSRKYDRESFNSVLKRKFFKKAKK